MQKLVLNMAIGSIALGYSLVGGLPQPGYAQSSSQPVEPEPSLSVEAQLQQATTLQNQGDFRGAIAIYESVLQQFPLDPSLDRSVGAELARLYAYIQEYDRSLERLQDLLTRYPNEVSLQLQFAQVTGWAGNFSLAAQRYGELLERHPENLEARLGQAEVLAWDGQYTDSMAAYDAVLQQQPDNLKAQLGQAQVQLWAGRTQDAIRRFQAILDRSPNTPEAQLGLARSYQTNRQLVQALATLEPLLDAQNSEALAIQREILATRSETEFRSDDATNGEASQLFQQSVQFPIATTNMQPTVRLGFTNFEQSGFESLQNYFVEVGADGRVETFDLRATVGADFFSRTEPTLRLNTMVEFPLADGLTLGTNLRYGAYKPNVQTLDNQITAFHLEPTLYWQLDRHTDLYLSYTLGLYNDNNTEQQALLLLRRELGDFFVAGTLLYWTYADDPQNGYFAPSNYFLYSGEVGWERQLFQPLTCRLAAALGQQRYESTRDNSYRLQAGCTIDFSPTLQLDLGYRLTNNDRLQSSSGESSTQQTIQGRLRYSF